MRGSKLLGSKLGKLGKHTFFCPINNNNNKNSKSEPHVYSDLCLSIWKQICLAIAYNQTHSNFL